MKIYLVRHGESEGNISRIHQPEDSPLSLEGERQADAIAARFAGSAIEAIISSPLARARQTAAKIASVTKKEISFDERIKELKRPSVVIGKTWKDPQVMKLWDEINEHRGNAEYHHSDEENFFDMHKRVAEFVKDVVKRKEKEVVVVSHGFAICTLIGAMIFGENFSHDHFYNMIDHMKISNTGITLCEYEKENGWRVITINDHAHLLD